MTSQGKPRRDYLSLSAIDPVDGKLSSEIQISYERMQSVGRRSMAHASECAYIVPKILSGPTAIFQGLRRDEDEDRLGYGWRCYCGRPQQAYRPDGTSIPPYRDQVFLVFINDERVAYGWRWEKADPDDLNLPVDHADRFQQRLL